MVMHLPTFKSLPGYNEIKYYLTVTFISNILFLLNHLDFMMVIERERKT
jgi:hypothetical protein